MLYPAVEDFRIDVMLGQGPGAQSVKLPLSRFTLIGATTRSGLLTAPLRARFGIQCTFDFYTAQELEKIVAREFRDGLSLVQALQVFLGIVQGIDYLHGKGIVHGDLFRDNALWQGDRLTGVLDFYFAGEVCR